MLLQKHSPRLNILFKICKVTFFYNIIYVLGGLSTGLEESGVAKVLWAVENNEMAAQARLPNYFYSE